MFSNLHLSNGMNKKIIYLACLGVFILNSNSTSFAQNTPTLLTKTKSNTYTLKEIGTTNPVLLKGLDARYDHLLNVRSDEIALGVKLKLQFYFSKYLLDNSELEVLVNDQTVKTIKLDGALGNQLTTDEIEIPYQILTANNLITYKFHGHYSNNCEDPRDSRLWFVLGNKSEYNITTSQFGTQNDLSAFPVPFIDPDQQAPSVIPFVFAGSPDKNTLEAAGILSSFLGASGYQQKIKFKSVFNKIPTSGNAIIFVTDPEYLINLNFKKINPEPSLAIIENPFDKLGKLLLVMGSNGNAHKTSVLNLIDKKRLLTGDYIQLNDGAPKFPKRVPYDAPAWVQTSKPIKISDISGAPTGDNLKVANYGSTVIPLDLPLPPDLYHIKGSTGIKVDLKFAFSLPDSTKGESASLGISDDQRFIRDFTLTSQENSLFGQLKNYFNDKLAYYINLGKSSADSEEIESRLDQVKEKRVKFEVPIFPNQSDLKLRAFFNYKYPQDLECVATTPIPLTQKMLLPSSSIDVSHVSHFIEMPNLSVFAQKGYPFTRLADLSETGVILNKNFNEQSISTYLTMMGFLGSKTHYPAIKVQVALDDQINDLRNKDLLIIDENNSSRILKNWSIPADKNSYTLSLGKITEKLFNKFVSMFDSKTVEVDEPIRSSETNAGLGKIIGFESPLKSHKSVVLLKGASDFDFENIQNALLNPADYKNPIEGTNALIYDDKINTFDHGDYYDVGSLNFIEFIYWTLVKFPILFILFGILSIIALTMILFSSLKAKAPDRI
jgi:cellulose synthase operon protein B